MADGDAEVVPEAEATLELSLSLLSVDAIFNKTTTANAQTLVSYSTLSSWRIPFRYYAIAWIDPINKQSVGPINPSRKRNHKRRRKLYLPIHTSTLEGRESQVVTIQILSHSRIPFHNGRLVGTAVLPLSDVKMSSVTFTLPIRRNSGAVRGTLEVSVRVLWDLGFRGNSEDAVVEDGGVSQSVGEYECGTIADLVSPLGGVVHPTAPPAPSESMESADEPLRGDDGEEGNFLLGLVLGALVVLFVGAACRRWRYKSSSPT